MDAGLPPVAFLLRDAGTGGAERSSLRLANALSRRGLSVSVLFLHARGPMLASLVPEVRVVDLHGSFLRLLSEVRRGGFGFLLPVYTAMRALLTKVILRGPLQVILSQRSMFTMERGPLQTRLRTLRYRLLAPRAAACVCISRGVADEMRSLGFLPPEKIHVIYNAVVTPELLAQIRAAAKASAPHPWLEAGQPPVVLGAGRLGDQKDFRRSCGPLPALPGGGLRSGSSSLERGRNAPCWNTGSRRWGSRTALHFRATTPTPTPG